MLNPSLLAMTLYAAVTESVIARSPEKGDVAIWFP